MFVLAALASAGDLHQLRAPSATASSWLKSAWSRYEENYHPTWLLDGNPATAWTEGARGPGVGESVSVPLTPQVGARVVELHIRNGYQKSAELLAANGAPADVRVELLGELGVVIVSEQRSLTRSEGWQIVRIEPVQPVDFTAVRLTILSVHGGRTYLDTAISDVEVYVDAGAWDPAVEAARHARAVAWMKERTDRAAFYAAMPATSPYASGTFVAKEVPPDPVAYERAVASLRALRAELEPIETWMRVETIGPVPPVPEGLRFLSPIAELLSGAPAWTEAATTTDRFLEEIDYYEIRDYRSNVRVAWGAPGVARATLQSSLTSEWIQQGMRGTYDDRSAWWTVRFDTAGRPQTALVQRQTTGATKWDTSVVTFRYDGARLIEVRVEGEVGRLQWTGARADRKKGKAEHGAIVFTATR